MQNINKFNPESKAADIAARCKQLRLLQNMSQKELSAKSGVSLGSLKRFEQIGFISLLHLIRLSLVLNASEEFDGLFRPLPYSGIDEMLKQKKAKSRKRAGRSV